MPQFDFTTYSSQIFWFGLCFITLFLFAQYVILPRIKNIIDKRIELIESDILIANEVDKKTNSINDNAQEILQKANSEYLQKIDEITKKAYSNREKSLEELKLQIEQKVSASRLEIRNFIAESHNKNIHLIENLTKIIKNKILN